MLRPSEFGALAEAAGRVPGWEGSGTWGGVLVDAMLRMGVRFVEGQRLQWHGSQWFDGRLVHLPEEAVLKAKRKQLERWVRLSPSGIEAVQKFLRCPVELPSRWGWTDALVRWAKAAGISPAGMSPKTTRKTWESWLVCSYPEHWMEILLSQGHTSGTSIMHYLNVGFWAEDKEEMKDYVAGFF